MPQPRPPKLKAPPRGPQSESVLELSPTSSSAADQVPAVVVGGTLNGLGVVRSLAKGRMPIYLLDTTRRYAAAWSRHSRFVRVPAITGSGLIDALLSLATRLGCRPVLLLTDDLSVDTVSTHRQEIQHRYRISLPPHEILRALADKTLFHALAEREGLPVPRSVVISAAADMARLETLTPPVIVKPASKTFIVSDVIERAVRASTLSDARRACARMLSLASRLIVQEWIDGPDTEIVFTLFSCDGAGRILGLFPGRKLLCFPPGIGSTAICVPAPEIAEELCKPTLQFIKQTGYRGLGSLEFKRDPRDGRLLIIEPTVGRTDWQEEVATLCGVNLPLRTYLGELGRAEDSADQPYPPLAWRSAAEFRVSLASDMRTVDGYFRWSDPLPALYHYGYERALLRAWRRLMRAGRTLFLSQYDGRK